MESQKSLHCVQIGDISDVSSVLKPSIRSEAYEWWNCKVASWRGMVCREGMTGTYVYRVLNSKLRFNSRREGKLERKPFG